MSNARDMAGLSSVNDRLSEVGNSDGALSNRNLIINGAMQVAQRGTGPVSAAPYQYNTADRMRFSLSSGVGGTWTQEVVTDQDVGDFIGNALKSSCSVAGSGGNVAGLNIRLELADVEKHVGKKLTLSYYAKSDAAVTLTPAVFADTVITMGTDTLTTSYVRYTHTFTLTSMSAKSFFDLAMRVDGAVATTHYITGVQLEVGDQSTPFEHRSYSQELALCERYYFTTWPTGIARGTNITATRNLGVVMAGSSSKIVSGGLTLPVEMRATPAVSTRSPTGLTGKYYEDYSALDFTYNYGVGIWAGTKYIGLSEYDAAANAFRAGYTHLFCDAEL